MRAATSEAGQCADTADADDHADDRAAEAQLADGEDQEDGEEALLVQVGQARLRAEVAQGPQGPGVPQPRSDRAQRRLLRHSGCLDVAEQRSAEGGTHEEGGGDGEGGREPQLAHEEARRRGAGELADGVGGLVQSVGRGDGVHRDDLGDGGLVGDLVEDGGRADDRGSHHDMGGRQPLGGLCEPEEPERGTPDHAGDHEGAAGRVAVDHHPGDQRQQDDRDELHGGDEAHLGAAGVQGGHRDQW